MSQFGVNVWWHVPEVAVAVETAKEALSAHGFSLEAMKEPTRRNEVSRAVRSLQDRRTKDQQMIARPTNENGASVTYGVLDEGHLDVDTVEFTQQTTVRLDKSTGEVGIDGVHADAVREAIAYYTGKATDEDVRAFLRRIIRQCRGVAKRPTGGIYFVPERFVPLIERAQAVLDDMKCGAHVYVEGVVNGERERRNVWEAVERDIDGELTKSLAAVSRIERSVKAVRGHEAKIAGLQQMMEVYTDLLGQEAEHEAISDKLADAVQSVAHKVSELQAGSAARITRTSKPRGSKVCDAAVDVLVQAGATMHYRDITKAMIESGAYDGCDKAEASVRGILQRRVAQGDPRIEKVGRGLYKATEEATPAVA